MQLIDDASPETAAANSEKLAVLRPLYSNSVFLGHPMLMSLRGAYWRKNTEPGASMHLDRDRCGIHWMCHAIPYSSEHILTASAIIDQHCAAHQLESNIAIINVSERVLHVFAAVIYDGANAVEDEAARRCVKGCQAELNAQGYSPYRLGIQSMHDFEPSQATYKTLVQQIKQTLDPNNILAPGRYDFSKTPQ